MVTQKELANMLKVSPTTLLRAIKDLNIPAEKIPGGGNATYIEDKYIAVLDAHFPKKPPLTHSPKEGAWYEQKYVADYFGISRKNLKGMVRKYGIKNYKPNHNITLYPDESIFELYNVLYISKELVESKLVPFEKDKLKTETSQSIKDYWKVSVFNEDPVGYVVKSVSLSESSAKSMVNELESLGIMARASKHRNPRREYYYCK